ncbi:invasion associated locus B family protein [Pluralibacter gergoviae]|uniref:Invasion associated locus B family protein n=1 Tax=Pluralibacter gergoviae TaxID=61647 RepID=A0A089PQX3_PLUGE|nr:invasion associated locus B family protein [Pluralibacter gergoviae]AIR02722.1 hypothetical protein LG71_23735 [Pluralibacter gergoviae]EKT9643473.1 invasion associated locus B family protein [Pluralibacter gergoviae]EKV0917525.1 invasion associated locus B family protein [Pluralibacter gergoviae]EKV3546203.1 invasion associated locus B family protein [Pluralibacter gergoviae]EKV9901664.1 invasion associated locus B family protein [Pluralibacter gergoviae]
MPQWQYVLSALLIAAGTLLTTAQGASHEHWSIAQARERPLQIESWVLDCTGAQQPCQVFQELTRTDTGRRALLVKFVPSGMKKVRMIVGTPLGVNLENGVAFTPDHNLLPTVLPFSGCLHEGCLAEANIDGARAVEGLTSMDIRYLQGQTPVNFSLNLKGLSAALTMAQRHFERHASGTEQ